MGVKQPLYEELHKYDIFECTLDVSSWAERRGLASGLDEATYSPCLSLIPLWVCSGVPGEGQALGREEIQAPEGCPKLRF